MYQCCIFDLDGTIINTLHSLRKTVNETIKQFGYGPIDEYHVKYFVGDGYKKLMERTLKYCGDTELTHYEAALEVYDEMFNKYCLYQVEPYAGMPEFLTMLKEKGIRYFGVGISGGEEGARRGPSIMPGGEKEAYEQIRPVLEKIAAYAEGEPCCTYIGPDGAGHYVKMVHNGIEYADMQLIAEAYILLKSVAGYTNAELGDIFEEWNQGELKSYLIGITADIFREKDDFEAGELLDYIVDSAAQKGTGRWASIESMKQGVDISMITAACNARILSNHTELRKKAAGLLSGPEPVKAENRELFKNQVRDALYAAKIAAYAQGFDLMRDASKKYGWNLDLGKIASIFRAGCIIQAVFLNDITEAYRKNPELDNLMLDEFFRSRLEECQGGLRHAAAEGIRSGLPLPAMTEALSYFDAFRGGYTGANLIQAQRDCFGAHTFERTDREGTFHHDWGKRN